MIKKIRSFKYNFLYTLKLMVLWYWCADARRAAYTDSFGK